MKFGIPIADLPESGLTSLLRRVPNRHENRHSDEMKVTYIRAQDETVVQHKLVAWIEPRTYQFAAQQATTRLTVPYLDQVI